MGKLSAEAALEWLLRLEFRVYLPEKIK